MTTVGIIVLLSFCPVEEIQHIQATHPTPTVSATTSSSPPNPGLPSWLTIYFTDPNPPDNLGHSIDQYIQPVIDSAVKTIDVASLDLNLPSLVNAFASASQRGVKVRAVYDGTNGSYDVNNAATNYKPFDALQVFKTAQIATVDGGRSNGLMHDKIIIVDSKVLFMGSWNLSYNDTYRNNNNLLKITDPTLIANYQAKFDEMFVDKRFGTRAQMKSPTPSLTIDGVQVENYFPPTDGVMDKLVSYVQGAKNTVHFMIYTYTDKNLAAAMIERAKAGVDVQGVIENRYAVQGAFVNLYCAGLPVKTDGNKYNLHHKVIIIDSEIVITGSFNFTKSADTINDENVLILHSPAVAALYEQEYQRVNSIGVVPQATDIKCSK